MRTAVYVDGFNLFHRMLEGQDHVKWLDLFALARTGLRRENVVSQVRYFTARVSDTESDPEKSTRQDIYLRALAASGVLIHYGMFRERQRRARVVDPSSVTTKNYVRIWSREEKGSDVNLAVHLVNDAWSDVFDCAVIISNDSDLIEALRLTREMGKIVGLLSPVTNPAADLRKHADFVRLIKLAHLRRSQFPGNVPIDDGSYLICPAAWATPSNNRLSPETCTMAAS